MQRFVSVPAFLTVFAMASHTSAQKMDTWRKLVFSPDLLKDSVLVIQDERADVLTDPLRWGILEILGDGKSITEISQTLEVTDARVLYHLRRLARTGVVRLEEDEGDPREWRCLPAAGTLRVREPLPGKDPTTEAIPAEVATQFNQAFREAAEGLYGSTFQMAVNHNRARLSEEQAAEFSRRTIGSDRRILSPRERGPIRHQVRFPWGSHPD